VFISKTTTFAASETKDNLIAGDQFEFAPVYSIVEIGMTQTAAELEVDVLCGNRAVVTRFIPMVLSTNPIYPDHFYLKFGALAGQRIIIRARNTTANTPTSRLAVKFSPR